MQKLPHFCGVAVRFLLALLVIAAPAGAQVSEHALRFHGTGQAQQDRVRIPVDDDVAGGADGSHPCDVGAGSFTIEFWVRGTLADNASANGGGDISYSDLRWREGNVVVDRNISAGSEREFGISIAGGFVRFGTGRGDAHPHDAPHTLEGNVNVLDEIWHHVACVRDAATGRKHIYVDGVPDASSAAAVSNADLSYPNDGVPGQTDAWGRFLVLGAEKHDAGACCPSFDGYFDELCIWSFARSAATIAASFDRVPAPESPGLVARYRFEEGTGVIVADSSVAQSPDGQLIAGIAGNGEWRAYAANPFYTAPVNWPHLPLGFERTLVATGLDEPTVLEFAPDGRLFVGQRGGAIRIVQNGNLLAAPLVQITDINTQHGERGLVGLAVDADFASNGYLYVYYTSSEPRDRVGRFQVVGNTAALASETILWQNPELAGTYHHGGALGIGPDGRLYIATGDQLSSVSSQDLMRENGKLLRVNPDGTIPADNPFVGVPGARPAIWARGLRNPFRFTFDTNTGALWIGDVGGNGLQASEEIDRGVVGANYGWPDQEGADCYTGNCSAFQFPAYSYRHDDAQFVPNLDEQGCVILGPVYHGATFPSEYHGNLFFADCVNRWIRRLVLDALGNVVDDPVFAPSPDAGSIVDLATGPDGALYYVTHGVPDVPSVYKIQFTGSSNQPPTASASANPMLGMPPLAVQFSSAGSVDPDNGPTPLEYSWSFGDGGVSRAANPAHTFASAGLYEVALVVSDGEATSLPVQFGISVGNAPSVTIDSPPPGTTYHAGDTIAFSGSAQDVEDGTLAASALTWQVLLVHAGHTHPFYGPVTGISGGNITIPLRGHDPGDTSYRIILSASDSDGLSARALRALSPVPSPITFTTDPPGIALFVDGEAHATPFAYTSLVGFQHDVIAQQTGLLGGTAYLFRRWSNGSNELATSYVAPEGGGLLRAIYAAQSSATVTVLARNRNAEYRTNTGQTSANAFDPAALCCGRAHASAIELGLEFELPIPRGSTISSAVLVLTAAQVQAGAPTASIRAYDTASAPAFVPGSPTSLINHAPLLPASVAWMFPPFTPGERYTSPDLSAFVQAVIDRPDWTANQYIGLVLDGSVTSAIAWRCIGNAASNAPPELWVTYTPLPLGIARPVRK
ncbi:MAG: PQQ-dependent sugar dehydrogenase [Planctomycetota bacterium]